MDDVDQLKRDVRNGRIEPDRRIDLAVWLKSAAGLIDLHRVLQAGQHAALPPGRGKGTQLKFLTRGISAANLGACHELAGSALGSTSWPVQFPRDQSRGREIAAPGQGRRLRKDGELTAFLRWLTHTHTMWHAHYHTSGTGHLYQGRFKAFPVEGDEHLYSVLRYVERNALRANLVERAEHWRWSSAYQRYSTEDEGAARLHRWPIRMPPRWLAWLNRPQSEVELAALRRSVNRGAPFGSLPWQRRTARRLGLQYTLRPRGRPRKRTQK